MASGDENVNVVGGQAAIHSESRDEEMAKARKASRRASDLSLVSQTLAISNFPPEVQAIMTEAFDEDGNGHIASAELVESAKLTIATRKCNRMLWKGLGLAIFVVLALVGINAGLTYGIIDASKETQVEGRSLMVRHPGGWGDGPVATSNNEVTVTIATIPFLPPSAVSHIEHVAFTSEDGETQYHKMVQSVVVTPKASVRLKTTDGDVIEWVAGDEKKLAITLEDGTEWKMCIYCTECTAANVYSTPEILEGIQNFEAATGMEARRHLSVFLSASSRRLVKGKCRTC
ncbi:hypothetical protein THAOC_20713 [Thalassiosira oceanica]|uniref:EF-hand domain-containing protein n=1 Tax=Thalassiosira oceanica TaxID=159749 RepID=K0S2R3_THAOC|nr:hypothetical protein THAOC_20713 [Thalassiosira oceanica]|eukprot:EJK59109.1 hypothetical protein THAOC_20713 [Thalassiosira oceanica]